MALSGQRPGAGRKKGWRARHTIEKEKAREYIIDRVVAELEPLMNVLIRNAKKGSLHAAALLFERAFGKVPQPMEHSGTINISHVLQQLINGGGQRGIEEPRMAALPPVSDHQQAPEASFIRSEQSPNGI